MKFGFVAGLLVLSAGFTGCSSSTNGSGGTAGTGILYVATQGDTNVSTYSVNLTSGALATTGKPLATGKTPSQIATTDKALFVANSQAGSISSYTFNSDGTLTAGSTTSVTNATSPTGLAVDSGNHFLFVANQGSFDLTQPGAKAGSVSVFSINAAALTEVAGSPFSTSVPGIPVGTGPVAVVADKSYLYVANEFTSTVTAFSFGSNGVLAPLFNDISRASYPVGTSPTAVGLTLDGNVLFVSNTGSNTISAFSACVNASLNCVTPDGSLTPVPNSPFPAGLGPAAMTVDSSGKFLYVVDSKSFQVSQYAVSTGTGALSALAPGTVSVGTTPTSIVVRVSSNATLSTGGTTEYVYVANSGSTSISTFSLDSTTGTLTLVGSPFTTTGGQPFALAVK